MRRRLPMLSYGCVRHAVSRVQAMWLSVCTGACSALAMYLFDPERGRRRRHMMRDMGAARMRRALRAGVAAFRGASADAYGMSHRMIHLAPKTTDITDDDTLRQRVESQLFRDRHLPKGDLNISAEHGTIILRGELHDATDIATLEERVRRMPGVRGVQNLLHPYGTPAPNKERSRMAVR